jgi:hypothetical protein
MTQASVELKKSVAVFEHAKRREWGLGVLAWETKNKRGYLFENGQLRVLGEGFYSLMLEVERPHDEVVALLKCLKPELDAARAEYGPGPRATRTGAATLSFDDQIAVFHSEYPAGFQDPKWVENHRGQNAKKRLSAHRDPAILAANEKLGARALETRIQEQAFRAIHDDIIALLRETDLVPNTEIALLTTSDPERQRAIALMTSDLLYGKVAFGSRFDHFLALFQQAVSKPAGWQLATAFAALREPRDHFSVRPAMVREQAKWLGLKLSIPKLPAGATYGRCMAMAKLVSAKLTERGETPRDMLDVYDFMRITTRSDSMRRLLEKRRALP